MLNNNQKNVFQKMIKDRTPPKRNLLDVYQGTSTASASPSPKNILLDHNYSLQNSPRKKIEKDRKVIASLRKKVKVTQKRVQRLKMQVTSLKSVVQHLKEKALISESSEYVLNRTFSGVPKELMKRMFTVKKSGRGKKYSEELIAFALTLQFYSTKAYEYVRQNFNFSLPSQSDLRRRYTKIPAEPGFTQPAFVELEKKVAEAEEVGKEVVCALSLDEMAIKKHVFFDGRKYHGFVDLGNNVHDDSLPAATQALVFMVVYVNSSWKVPVGYFLLLA